MSLIVTSSEQAEQYGRFQADGRARQQIGIEENSNYKNHFTVPLKIPADAEIAVESVKIRRGGLFEVMDDALLWRYFGNLHETELGKKLNGDGGGPMSMPIPIRPTPGTYTLANWANEIEDKFNRGYQNPELWFNTNVNIISNASGEQSGISIAQRQRGSASNAASGFAASLTEPMWRNPYQYSVPGKTTKVETGLEYTALTRTLQRLEATSTWTGLGPQPEGYNEKLDDLKGSSICSIPIGLTQAKVTFNMPGKGSKSFRYGLSRPQLEYKTGDMVQNLYPGVQGPGLDQEYIGRMEKILRGRGNPHFDDFCGDEISNQQRYQADYYDYLFEIDNDGIIGLYQNLYDEGTRQFFRGEVIYYGWNASIGSQLTSNTAFPTYDRLTFETCGDEVVCYLHQAFSTGRLYLSNSNTTSLIKATSATSSSRSDRCFAPINECRTALYPKVTIGTQNSEVVIHSYGTHYKHSTFPGGGTTTANFMNASNYRFPVAFDGDIQGTALVAGATQNFVTGDDFYSNNRVPRVEPRQDQRNSAPNGSGMTSVRDYYGRQYALDQSFICDSKEPYTYWARTQFYKFSGLLNPAGLATAIGIGYKQALVVGNIGDEASSENDADYFEGRYSTLQGVQGGTLSRSLGYGDRAYLVEVEPNGSTPAYVGHAHALAQVLFNPVQPLQFKSNSCFVRLPRLTLTSFNGAKSSVSKIVYQVPKFTNDGREFGDLYFAPGEKTYVKLENTEPMLMNNLEVQMVDVGEKVIKDLQGPTIIVFHVRKSKQ